MFPTEKKDDEDESIVWTSVHSFQYKKDKIYFKYNYDDPYRTLTILRGRQTSKSTGGIERYLLKKCFIYFCYLDNHDHPGVVAQPYDNNTPDVL